MSGFEHVTYFHVKNSGSVCSSDCPGGISRRMQYHDCGSDPIVEELVVLIAVLPGSSGPLAFQHVPVNELDGKLISAVLIPSKRLKSVVAVVIELVTMEYLQSRMCLWYWTTDPYHLQYLHR